MRRLVLVLCAACGSVSNDKKMDAAVTIDTSMVDSPVTIDAPPGPPCDVTKPFGAPVLVPGVNSNAHERYGYFSADELTVYFSDVATNREIFTATRASTSVAFSTPTALSDGLEVLFSSNRPDAGDVDIWRATRTSTSAAWGTPVAVAELNTADTELASGSRPIAAA